MRVNHCGTRMSEKCINLNQIVSPRRAPSCGVAHLSKEVDDDLYPSIASS